MNSEPYFSIVIPAFNREKEVLRAVNSCLLQEFQSFEVVVVDDGSTDGTATVVEELQDKRVQLIRHAKNRGECPARNTGVAASAGDWIVFLDSDDELLPGCLQRGFELTADPSVATDRVAFSYRYDDGRVSPHPYPARHLTGYDEWLDFQEHALLSDALWLTKRATFHDCPLPDSRVAPMSYNLEFASKYQTRFVPEIRGVVYTDSSNRLSSTSSAIDAAKARDRARDDAADMEVVLARHGSALRQRAPSKYGLVHHVLAVSHTMSGSQLEGVRHAYHLVLFRPLSPKGWMLLVLSILGARAMNYARWCKHRALARGAAFDAPQDWRRIIAAKLLSPGMKSTILLQLSRVLNAGELSIASARRRFGVPDPNPDRGSALKIGCFGGFQVAYRDKTADEAVLGHSFDHDIFFRGVPDYQPDETDIILDVGAHIGTFATLAASKVSRGAVYAIEACEDTFNCLRINAALNRLENLSTFHLALSDRRGTCTLYYDRGNWGHSVVSRLSNRSEVVESCTLQQFFDENHIDKCSFIKFNCEGAEFPILLSSPTSLLRRVGKMLVLYHGDLWTKNTPEELLTHLGASGFECTVANRTEKRGWIIATNTSIRNSPAAGGR